jgi:hypothetical protein
MILHIIAIANRKNAKEKLVSAKAGARLDTTPIIFTPIRQAWELKD